jgi:hypothetical protein
MGKTAILSRAPCGSPTGRSASTHLKAGSDPPQGPGGDPPRGHAPTSIRLDAVAATRLKVATAGRELRGGGGEVAPGRRPRRELRWGGGSGRELRRGGGSGDRPRGTKEGGDRVGFRRGRGGWIRGSCWRVGQRNKIDNLLEIRGYMRVGLKLEGMQDPLI